MKTKNFKLFGTLKAFTLIAVLSIITLSCDNQEIQEMDEMNLSETAIGENLRSSNSAPKKGENSIAGTAVNAGFNELVGALVYVDKELNAGLVELFMNGKDQYTVFAPTDAAFKKLYMDLEVEKITDLPAPLVLDVLKYHVVEGRRAANSVVPSNGYRTITTLLGATFSVDTSGMIMAVGNTAKITTANTSASNGIIHVIDTVLLPIK